MNFLSIFVLIPLLMMIALFFAKNRGQINFIAATGATILLAFSAILTYMYLAERASGNVAEMLFRADVVWYAAFNIHYSVGVDGVSVAMLLLTSVIVFTGVFASWRIDPLPKEFFLWFCLLSIGVYGFFISIDLFTMFMFYEIALIPMYLLIGIWGTGKKEYAAMKLTLMLMGGSALLLVVF
jgi:NADH-quinone oxidoreductase subunit M